MPNKNCYTLINDYSFCINFRSFTVYSGKVGTQLSYLRHSTDLQNGTNVHVRSIPGSKLALVV